MTAQVQPSPALTASGSLIMVHGLPCTGTVPVIAGAPVEEHLRTACQQSFRHGSPDGRSGPLLPPIKHSSRSSVPPPAGTVQQQGSLGAGRPIDSQGVAALGAQGTGHRNPDYRAEVLLPGLNVVVPRHLTLRQSVPYDSVRQAELLEAKVGGGTGTGPGGGSL
jgi:hypothetical protein